MQKVLTICILHVRQMYRSKTSISCAHGAHCARHGHHHVPERQPGHKAEGRRKKGGGWRKRSGGYLGARGRMTGRKSAETPPSAASGTTPEAPEGVVVGPSRLKEVRSKELSQHGQRNATKSILENGLLAPLLDAEAELSHDAWDDRQHDDYWWEERRDDYVQLYRQSAQIESQAKHAGVFTRTYLLLPPARAHEQAEIEEEGQEYAEKQPHLRWCERDWRDVASEALDTHPWPPWINLVRLLREAESEIFYEWPISWPLKPKNPHQFRFDIGNFVEVRTDKEWEKGIIVWKNYIDAGQCHAYQIALFETETRTLDNAYPLRLICVSADDEESIVFLQEADEEVPLISRAVQDDIVFLMLQVLFQAWWIMPWFGYDECDIDSGWLDDIELWGGIAAAQRLASSKCTIMCDRAMNKIFSRLCIAPPNTDTDGSIAPPRSFGFDPEFLRAASEYYLRGTVLEGGIMSCGEDKLALALRSFDHAFGKAAGRGIATDQIANGSVASVVSTTNDDPGVWLPPKPMPKCPVCQIPLPLDESQYVYMSCCGKEICCACENKYREEEPLGGINRTKTSKRICASCKMPHSEDDKEAVQRVKARANGGDVRAMVEISDYHASSDDEGKVWLHRAVELQFTPALRKLGLTFEHDCLGEAKDISKARHYYQEGVRGGDAIARFYLGNLEQKEGHDDVALRHYILAASSGCRNSMEKVCHYYCWNKIDAYNFIIVSKTFTEEYNNTNSTEHEQRRLPKNADEEDEERNEEEEETEKFVSQNDFNMAFKKKESKEDDNISSKQLSHNSYDKDPSLWVACEPSQKCDVCGVPLPIEYLKSVRGYRPCCGKQVCDGCSRERQYAYQKMNNMRYYNDLRPLLTCPYCGENEAATVRERTERLQKRINAGDARAALFLAHALKLKDEGAATERRSIEFYHLAASMGSLDAFVLLGSIYFGGELGAEENKQKAAKYWIYAARRGSIFAHYNLHCVARDSRRLDLASNHCRLAAAAGHCLSMDSVKLCYLHGATTMEELIATAESHKIASDEMCTAARKHCLADPFYKDYHKRVNPAMEEINAEKVATALFNEAKSYCETNKYLHIKLMKMAADVGSAEAKGHLVYIGCVKRDAVDEAKESLYAAARECPLGRSGKYRCQLAYIFLNEGNCDQYIQMLIWASNDGHQEATYLLGCYKLIGKYCNADLDAARRYLELASNLGHPCAERVLEARVYPVIIVNNELKRLVALSLSLW